ncbi:MAG: DUF5658 family protein [Armatimonadota bacterium]|nr:DUF5658 family protein [Armatimonadota bacterium]
MHITFSKESIVLIAICLADMLFTILVIAMGKAVEANPLMAECIRRGFWHFCLVKIGVVIPLVVLAEWYKNYNPVFVRKALRVGITGYISLYFGVLLAVNLF